jgi:hypothetical protein|tara:strand:+ start:425 stop:937 length:513 start_codon:yes stop_codon:yes gene_type:complete
MKSFKNYIKEASKRSVSRQRAHYEKGRSTAGISAYRGDRTPSENKKADKELKSKIKKSGHGYVKVHGTYPETHKDGTKKTMKEPSYIIHAKGTSKKDHRRLKKFAKRAGKEAGQESVLMTSKKHGSRLHGTKKKSWPGKGKSVKVGKMKAGRGGDYHTQMVQPKQKFSYQ